MIDVACGEERGQEAAPRPHEAPGAGEPAADCAGGVRTAADQRPRVSIVMPTVGWSGTFEPCAGRCLQLIDTMAGAAELVVVLDAAASPPPAWLDRSRVTVVASGSRRGPAQARNIAAAAARGEILFFVDADVVLAGDSLERVLRAFAQDPDLVAVFGAYDDEPLATGTVSQFRNLLHHHTHVVHPGRAGTFWSGCGAILAASFAGVGGFDEGYRYPSVEDIELGMRIVAAGGKIVLDPSLSCKHAKRWSLGSMIYTDIMHRARPWTHLIAVSHSLPDALNIDGRGRLSGVCAVGLIVAIVATLVLPAAALPALGTLAAVCAAVLFAVNLDFYRLCLRKRGLRFAVAAIALHWLYYAYSSLTFGLVMIQEHLLGLLRLRPCRSSLSSEAARNDTASIERRSPMVGP